MPKFVLLVLFGLAACAASDATQPSGVEGWRNIAGKRPTRAEYAAVVAACQDGSVARAAGKPFEACLADLGLKRVP